ncbi:MAG: tRNA (N(6)-L-threonylcarbamoyladenosine(37)-C(2))-methylthiotransferase MtaB [Firmicutes bacterium]|nr:tRNA (N(6)-L-threonylcarbamoyladenosine(37)-C(2))-methylthiotransferase MtaB [Bacillota bacterium]
MGIWGDLVQKMAVATLGCKVNYCESEALKELFRQNGYKIVDFGQKADLYIINTCTVTHLSDRKSRQLIRKARRQNPEAIICVTGCYAQVSSEEVLQIEEVDLIVGTHNRQNLPQMVDEARQRHVPVNLVERYPEGDGEVNFEELPVSGQGRTRAFLKIQEGCRQFCSYCIIPYARGPLRSRSVESVLKAVKELAASGFKELVLTGVHLGLYGKDLGGNNSLASLLEQIHRLLEDTGGIERLRLSSLEPADMTPDLIETVVKLEKICAHLHLPLQSGDDEILKKMRRPYDRSWFRALVQHLRQQLPDIALTTDVMVGFPGETEAHFWCSYRFIEEMQFSRIHVFKYSPRRGTPAAKMSGQITPEVKDERSKVLMKLADELSSRYRRRFIGRTLPVLFEGFFAEGWLEGLTEHYLRVRAKAKAELSGKLISTKIYADSDGYLLGRIED